MKLQLPLFILLSVLTIFACSTVEKELLIGKWEIDFMDGVSDKDLENMRDIRFEFLKNGRYTFHSTLNIKEAGQYSIDGDLLNTTDTTAANPKEKSVKITKLTSDSLYFLMNKGGQKQHLQFVRQQ